MHKLNVAELVGYDFYAKPAASGAKRLEYIYNTLFGTLPHTLQFSDEFEFSCLKKLEEYFELMCSDVAKVGDKIIEEGVWIGKENTQYANVFLSIGIKGKDGDNVFYDGIFTRGVLASAASSDEMYISIRAVCPDKEQIRLLIEVFEPFKMKRTNKMYILAQEYGDLAFTAMPIPDSKVDLELNYGKEFLTFHRDLIQSINETTSGLYLFYGEPGTGKSSYIKHLLTGEISRKIAYIPVSLIDKLTHPDMVPLLMSNKDIVLVLEDAEKALLSRDLSENSAIVSTILNLTDGFIGQALNITIIATFNTERDKIDGALLRKGRLKLSHEFAKISVENCKDIARKIGINPDKIKEPMTLAEIYNYTDDTHYEEPKEKRVGFFND